MGLLILKADHLPVLASLVGFAGTCQINRLQDIGLSLGIVAVETVSYTHLIPGEAFQGIP